MRTTISVLGIGLILCARVNAQACLGDCNGNGAVSPGELTKVIAIIGLCDSMAIGCGAVAGGCVNADKNGNGTISAGELTNIISNILNFPNTNGCPPTTPGATNTPAAGNTPTRTFTIPPSPTPTATTAAAPVCGNRVVEGDEECDQGGVCTGGDNAGTACSAESDCLGDGICLDGTKIGWVCSNDTDCPGSRCIRCKTFGGNGCAANCTNETSIKYDLVTGTTTKLCLNGANDSKPCTVAGDCPNGTCATQITPGTTGSFVHDGFVQLAVPLKGFQTATAGKLRDGKITLIIKAANSSLDRVQVGALACACVRTVAAKSCGGTLFEKDGTGAIDCSPGFSAGDSVCAGKKPCSFVHGAGNATSGIIGCSAAGLDGINLNASQASNGQAVYRKCVGGSNDGAACTLPVDCPGATCSGSCVGGTNSGALCTVAADCPGATCSGANLGKPCTTAAGCPSGACGCANIPAPTPGVGSGPALITLSGSGPAGSAIILNSSAIGTVTGFCTCTGGCLNNPNVAPLYGPDHEFCTDDDLQSPAARGLPSTLPQVTGKATGIITNTAQSTQTHFCDKDRTKTCTKDADCPAGTGPCTREIGPFSYTGKPYDCSKLTAPTPSTQGGSIAGAFTQLNQVATGDIVVRNVFVVGAPRP